MESLKKFNMSISMVILKVMIVIRLILGNYYSISKSKWIRFLSKMYCAVFTLVTTYFILNYFSSVEHVHPLIFALYLEYMCSLFYSLFFIDDSIFNFCSAIKSGDQIMAFKNVPLFSNNIVFLVLLTVLVRLFLCVLWFTTGDFELRLFFHVCSILFSLDVSYVTITIFFSILHSRVKLLSIFLETNFVPINIVGVNNVVTSIKNIRNSLYYYNNLFDCIQLVDKELQYMLSSALVINMPRLVIYAYQLIEKILFYGLDNYSHFISNIIEIAQIFFVISCSPVVMGAILQEVDKIKKTLTMQILRCSDESLRLELEAALQYVTLRPFNYKICRVVPFNGKLPFVIIGFCITYTIIIMQLTHFAF